MARRSLLAALASAAAAAVALLAPSQARATNYSLWVHGYSPLYVTAAGNYNQWDYWGPSSYAGGVNKRSVNWGGQGSLASTSAYVLRALDCYCTGSNWCYLAGHSTGDLQIGYALSLYGGSARTVSVPDTAGADGTCQGAGSGTQTGWNIKWIDVSGGAAGGSELAPLGDWFAQNTGIDSLQAPILKDLYPSQARASYDHNQTRGRWFYMFSGANGTIWSGTLPGQDDEVVAYHSSGGLSSTGSFCNPWDLFCDGTLETGTTRTCTGLFCSSPVSKWSYHTVQFRDDSESYVHISWSAALNMNDWGGIISLQRQDMVTYAQ